MCNPTASNLTLKYAAELDNVTEVTLRGTADLLFWQDILRRERLFPYAEKGQAVLLLSATDAKWKKFKFREFVISVGVCFEEHGTRLDGYYLPHAFNSSRLLAFSERMFFRTPYFQGDIQLENRLPVSIKLQDKTDVLLGAEMSAPDVPPIVEYQEWQGPIFLPNNSGKFFAVLAGETDHYPFSPQTDRFELKPSPRYEIFQQLIESNFVGTTWSLRSNARHAKSKTYKRDAELSFPE